MIKATIVQLIANATAAGKAWLLAADAAAQKALLSLSKSDVGLSNVDNTSDANKPVSTATSAALAGKQATLISGTNIKTVNSTSLLGSGDLAITAGLGGSTGLTDNRVLRSDGTGGATLQNSAVTIDDSGNVSGAGTIASGAITSSGQVIGTSFKAASQTAPYTSVDHFNGLYRNRIVSGSGLVTEADRHTLRGIAGASNADVIISGTLTISGTDGSITASGLMRPGVYTVATLPSASANASKFAVVTDSSVTTNGTTVAGGGANRVMVFSNGTDWKVIVA